MYPSVLQTIASRLPYRLADYNGIRSIQNTLVPGVDGRIASKVLQPFVISAIEEISNTRIVRPTTARSWYDFGVYDPKTGINIPVNLIITKRQSKCNIKRNKGLVYTFSTLHNSLIPNKLSMNDTMEYIECSRKSKRDPDAEYYTLFVDRDTNETLLRSMCDIHAPISSASNWLQASMETEMQYSHIFTPDINVSYYRIRSTLAASLKKRIFTANSLLL